MLEEGVEISINFFWGWAFGRVSQWFRYSIAKKVRSWGACVCWGCWSDKFFPSFLIHSQNLNQFPETRSTFTFWKAQCNEATQIHILPTICIARMAHAKQQSCAIWKTQSDKQQKLCLKNLIPQKKLFPKSICFVNTSETVQINNLKFETQS